MKVLSSSDGLPRSRMHRVARALQHPLRGRPTCVLIAYTTVLLGPERGAPADAQGWMCHRALPCLRYLPAIASPIGASPVSGTAGCLA
jgi:hypothetical protein